MCVYLISLVQCTYKYVCACMCVVFVWMYVCMLCADVLVVLIKYIYTI